MCDTNYGSLHSLNFYAIFIMQGMLLMHILSICDLVIHMIAKMQPLCIRIILVGYMFYLIL